jgi:thymidylate synthase ThyX
MIETIEKEPAGPISWGRNQRGMQASGPLDSRSEHIAQAIWYEAAADACRDAKAMMSLEVHKQIVNRVLEPYSHIEVVATATEWDNFFALRTDAAAQPEIQFLASEMLVAMNASKPMPRGIGEWHFPYVTAEERMDLKTGDCIRASAARCARVSYAKHGTDKIDLKADMELAQRLLSSRHLSPFEHMAEALGERRFVGNFWGWTQYRKGYIRDEMGGPFEGLKRWTYKTVSGS